MIIRNERPNDEPNGIADYELARNRVFSYAGNGGDN
jgi:hypothetical protein